MSKKIDISFEDEESLSTHLKRRKTRPQVKKPVVKQSYEANADVQRWLNTQTIDQKDLTKPPFAPTFLAGQRDASWILSSLSSFYEQDLITDVLHVVKSGKEATVYCCLADPLTGLEYAAAKVYRPRMFRSLRNDAVYRQGRTQRDVEGHVVRNSSHHQAAFKSQRGRAMQVSSWIEYEFQTQLHLFAAGANIPRPLAQVGNSVLMEYIGTVGEPAPLLQNVILDHEEAPALLASILNDMELFLAHNRIHGDLSAYNIVYWEGEVKIIDFAQAVDPTQSEGTFPIFLRDVERVASYFAQYNLVIDALAVATEIWTRQQGAF
ncbi:RIO1 family regulatory kinase/ATPase domain-containing protein [Tengunoibacter tsumagoiensis]|uniref:non-specific serine/threonine protein kinase n=1 Tax=Tengunoibacter tsumagoiensis TaxID=2014871 RepID=A0A402A6R6_9CHLR|nr:RIO1 family regulatory kinase/ATPase [Tengunoibacter tsumagoiensis]GCE14681.1 hypothetical protein KTT_45400 [Tengunoibacter tsumagoiensis]